MQISAANASSILDGRIATRNALKMRTNMNRSRHSTSWSVIGRSAIGFLAFPWTDLKQARPKDYTECGANHGRVCFPRESAALRDEEMSPSEAESACKRRSSG